ncbi:MAG TPA: DedA family protein [Ktedonobacteraceae bacterium]|nr:DedA family protein [Ktedonobacteraceae bacterium]
MIQTFQQIPDWLIYLVVAIFLLVESSGLPVINAVLLLFTGALAALGRLNLGLLIFAAILGSTLGACSGYFLGRNYGEKLLLKLAGLMRLDIKKVRVAQRWFQQSGGRMVFLSRIIPYIRPFTCIPAGISSMPFGRFFFWALTGSIIWCITLLIAGWELGPRWHLALDLIKFYTVPVILVLILVLIVSFFARRALIRMVKKRFIEQDEELEQDRDLLEV